MSLWDCSECMKGQSSIEFLVAAVTLIAIFTLSLVVYFNNSSDVDYSKMFLEAKRQCFLLSDTINSVAANGAGSGQTLDIPDKINFKDYNITVYSNAGIIDVSWDEETVACGFFGSNITNKTAYTFDIKKGIRTVENVGGQIVIE